jgi:CheY-like chemotaxis protein
MVPSAAPSPSPAPSPAGRPVVLVADDYPENRRLLYFYLRDRYEVLQAETAEEAIELLRSQRVDLTILDLNFCDGMSGIEAIQIIRRDPALAHVRALALTAYAYPDDRQRCLDAGFDAYLAKPVFKPAILEKLAEMLGPDPSGDGAGGEVGSVWIVRRRDA